MVAQPRLHHDRFCRQTSYGGTYASPAGPTIVVNPSSGRGDVFTEGDGFSIVAKCKVGIINTKHAGPTVALAPGPV